MQLIVEYLNSKINAMEAHIRAEEIIKVGASVVIFN
jgi:hypothetical protein